MHGKVPRVRQASIVYLDGGHSTVAGRSAPVRGTLLVAIAAAAVSFGANLEAQAASHRSSRTRVVMLGTGTPSADPDRFGPATVIIVDSTPYLVDFGVGVVRRWAAALRARVAPLNVWDLKTAFLTHLHSDHTLGFSELIFTSWTLEKGPRRPLEVYGPEGLGAMTGHLLAAYAADIRIRTDSGGELAGSPPPAVRVHEIQPGVIYRDSLVTVTAFLVHHGTWPQAFGYRFQTPDKDIVISGDAGPPSTIPAQCHQCDILIHEGGYVNARMGAFGPYQRSFHTSADELAAIANQSHPKLLVLYHQPSGEEAERLNAIRARYRGAVVVAKDLDVFQ
jgi:ribonuclease BN (tRNA processing enzyme)